MCSGTEASSYSRLIDFVNHRTLGFRVIEKRKKFGFKRLVLSFWDVGSRVLRLKTRVQDEGFQG